MEAIPDVDYRHGKRVWKDFETKTLGKSCNLYVRSNTVLLADVFKNFWNICLKIYKFKSVRFLTAPRLA